MRCVAGDSAGGQQCEFGLLINASTSVADSRSYQRVTTPEGTVGLLPSWAVS